MEKEEIICYYNDLCKLFEKRLTRAEYREIDPKFSTYLIEKIWGTWTEFVNETNLAFFSLRVDKIKFIKKDIDNVVISYVQDGSDININMLNCLENYCKINKAELCILWGKNINKNKYFKKEIFDRINKYLCTKIIFEKDNSCLAQDFLIPNSQKNPLINLDKLSTDISTIIVGSTKQYLKTLPYKNYNDYRISFSTGTLSKIEYKETVSGYLDTKYHTFGALRLYYDKKALRYKIRNLIFKNDYIFDLDKYYDDKKSYPTNIDAMVLGDLHLPDEDALALDKTKKLIKELKPNTVILHDIASWNSISHHEANKYFSKIKNKTPNNITLEKELSVVISKLNKFVKDFSKINFKIVNSNHDDFIRKFLETGEFVKDTVNAKIGSQLFLKYLDDKNILTDYLPKNVEFLEKNKSFMINGYELSEHGHSGISGANGSINSFNKGFEKIIIGHTHSPEIFEKVVVVGTLSKLIMPYNQNGLTKWVHANCILHKNGTFQIIFL